MNTLQMCTLLVNVTKNADKIEKIEDLLNMLEHTFVRVFKSEELEREAQNEKRRKIKQMNERKKKEKLKAQRANSNLSDNNDDTDDDEDDDDDEDTIQNGGSSSSTTCSSPSSFASMEEEKLALATSVRQFHQSCGSAHRNFFTSPDYHLHAALFVHSLLLSLSGNSRSWFRELQLECIGACRAILAVVGTTNARQCVPGVVSAATRYLSRTRRRSAGKDSRLVQQDVLGLLELSLEQCLTPRGELKLVDNSGSNGGAQSNKDKKPSETKELELEKKWFRQTVPRLAEVMERVLKPSFILQETFDYVFACQYRDMVLKGITLTICLQRYSLLDREEEQEDGESGGKRSAPSFTYTFLKQMLIAYGLIDNMCHMREIDENYKQGDSKQVSRAAEGQHKDKENDLFANPLVQSIYGEALKEKNKGQLIHLGTFLLRQPHLRSLLIFRPDAPNEEGEDEEDKQMLTKETEDTTPPVPTPHPCLRLVKGIIYYVGSSLPVPDLYSSRPPRSVAAAVVDECIESLAHSLAALPPAPGDDQGEEEEEESAGEYLTNACILQWEEVLQDWDQYPSHPAVLYVLTRLIIWQFKLTPSWWRASSSSISSSRAQEEEEEDEEELYPLPSDFVLSGALEQLWAVCGANHLWNISEDEELCSYQQIHHRQIIAATILRALSVIASDVLSKCDVDGDGNNHSLDRFNALLLYLIMEKATVPGIVHDAAMDCLSQLGTAFCSSSASSDIASATTVPQQQENRKEIFDFYIRVAHVLVDEAARAIAVESLRASAASVLRGAVEFIVQQLRTRGTARDGKWFSSSTKLSQVVRERLSITAVHSIVHFHEGDESEADGGPSPQKIEGNNGEEEEAQLLRVSQVADFAANTIRTAVSGLQMARREQHIAGVRAAVTLLKDCFDIAAFLNFTTPQETMDEDQERQTTAANPRVGLLQLACLNGIQDVLFLCSTSGEQTAPLMIQCIVRGLTVFLTTAESITWAQEQTEKLQEEIFKEAERKNDASKPKKNRNSCMLVDEDEGDEEEEEASPHPPELATTVLPWRLGTTIVLPQSHLKTIYRVYLSFTAMLREPIAAFLTSASTPQQRSTTERRRLELTPIKPSTFLELLEGMESLLLLAEDFLIHRTVQEVVPVLLVYYEKATLPRLPTNTEEKIKLQVRKFMERLQPLTDRYGQELSEELQKKTSEYFGKAVNEKRTTVKVEEV